MRRMEWCHTRTGLPVLLYTIDSRSFACPAAKTSVTRMPTKSQPLLNRPRSRVLPAFFEVEPTSALEAMPVLRKIVAELMDPGVGRAGGYLRNCVHSPAAQRA